MLVAIAGKLLVMHLPTCSLVLGTVKLLGLVHTEKQSFRPIFVPISGTDKLAVHTGTHRLCTNFFCVQTGTQ